MTFTEFKNEGQQTLDTGHIDVPERLRPTDLDYVEALKVSIADKGQMQPIEVVKNPRRESKTKAYKPYVLISGAHRLAACEVLCIDILCSVVSYQGLRMHEFDTACRLREIDENLVRHELNALDRAVFLHERKKIYEELYPETKAGGDRQSADFKDGIQNDTVSFCSDTAEKLGLSERTIERACSIAKNISPELRARIAGTELSRKQGELLHLAKQAPELQEDIVDALLREGAPVKSVGAAIKVVSGTPVDPNPDKLLTHLKNAYRDAPAATKKQFLYHLRDIGELKKIEETLNG